jgi:hypothetical protein
MFFRFFQLTEKSEWIPIEDKANVVAQAKERGAKRLTILACSDPAPSAEAANREAIQYKGPLYFDIDCKEDLPAAIAACRKLVEKLADAGVPDDCAEVYCSGSKGMHVIVDARVFSTGRGALKLPAIYKEMAVSLFVEGLDLGVYSGKTGVCWRIPNVQRDDGNYRVRITHEELAILDEPTYRALCSSPREGIEFKEPSPIISARLQNLFEECKRRVNLKPRVQVIATDAQLKQITEMAPACVQDMINWRNIEADRNFNYISLQVSAYLARAGVDQHAADSMLGMLALKGKSSQYGSESARREHLRGMSQYVKHTPSVTFSCAAMRAGLTVRPCEGCAIESTGGSQEEEIIEAGVIARRDGYYTTTGRHDIKISNFTLDIENVFNVLPQDGSKPLRTGATVSIIKNGEKLRSTVFSEEAWAGKSGFIREVAGVSNLSFTGSDTDVQRIKQMVFAQAEDAGEIMQVFTAGIHADEVDGRQVLTYVEPGFSINSLKVTGTHIMNNKIVSPPYFNSVELCQKGSEEADNAMLNMLQINSPEAIARIVGWFTACHLKTHLKLLYNQFPLLNIWGNAGSGKSKTVAIISWLNGTDYLVKDTSVNVTDITPFALLDFCSSTLTVPRICEEYNRSKINQKTYTLCGETFKAAWNSETKLRGAMGGKGTAGRTGAVSHQIPVTAPLVIASEQAVSMPALIERSIQVMVSKNSRFGRDHHLAAATKARMELRKIGKALMFKALTTKVADVEMMMEECADAVPDGFDTRPRYSYEVVRMGLMFLQKVLGTDLQLPESAAKVGEILVAYDRDLARLAEDDSTRSVRTEIDVIIETMGVMAARAASSSLTGKGVSGLERGIHYAMYEDYLVIDYMLAHALYKQYSRQSEGVNPAVDNTAQFLILLQQEPYYVKVESVGSHFADGRPVVWLSIAAMATKGLTTQLYTAGG